MDDWDIGATFSGAIATRSGTVEFDLEDVGESAVLRALCCLIIGSIPDEGLNETFDTLQNLNEHYNSISNYQLQPPTKMLRSNSRIVKKSVRPGSYLSE